MRGSLIRTESESVRLRARRLRAILEEAKGDFATPLAEEVKRIEDRLASTSSILVLCGEDLSWCTALKNNPFGKGAFSTFETRVERLSKEFVKDLGGSDRIQLRFDGAQHTMPLVKGKPLQIGRHVQRSIFVGDDRLRKRISRRHLEVDFDEAAGAWVVRDLGSTYGTYIGKGRLTDPHILKEGDQVSLSGVGSSAVATLTLLGSKGALGVHALRVAEADIFCLVFDATAPPTELQEALVRGSLRAKAWGLVLLPVGPADAVRSKTGTTSHLMDIATQETERGGSIFSSIRVLPIEKIASGAAGDYPEAPRLAKYLHMMVDDKGIDQRASRYSARLSEIVQACIVEAEALVMSTRTDEIFNDEERKRKEQARSQLEGLQDLVSTRVASYFLDLRERAKFEKEDKESSILATGLPRRTQQIIDSLVPITLSDLKQRRTDIYLVHSSTAAALKRKLHIPFTETRHQEMQQKAHDELVKACTEDTLEWALDWLRRIKSRKGPDSLNPLALWLEENVFGVVGGAPFSLDSPEFKTIFTRSEESFRQVTRETFANTALATQRAGGGIMEFTQRHITRSLYSTLTIAVLGMMLFVGTGNRTELIKNIGDAIYIRDGIAWQQSSSSGADYTLAPYPDALRQELRSLASYLRDGGVQNLPLESFENPNLAISVNDVEQALELLRRSADESARVPGLDERKRQALIERQDWAKVSKVGPVRIGHLEGAFPIWPAYALGAISLIFFSFRKHAKAELKDAVAKLKADATKHYVALSTEVLKRLTRSLEAMLKQMEKEVNDFLEPVLLNCKVQREALGSQITKHAQAAAQCEAKIGRLNAIASDLRKL